MRLLLIVVLLAGCAAPEREVNGIVWHRAGAKETTVACFRVYGKVAGCEAVSGFYYWEGGRCHVYAPDTTSKSGVLNGDMDVLGHEVKHCFDGLFHGGVATALNTRKLSEYSK